MVRMPDKSVNGTVKRKVGHWLLALLCFCGLALSVISFTEMRKDRSPDLVIFGDSIFAQMEAWIPVSDRLQAQSGLTVLGGAFGGTCLARQNVGNAMDFDRDILSMAVLARAVASEDLVSQQSVRVSEPATWYFEETVDELDQVDFDRVKILLLAFGMNDYHSAIPVENIGSPMDETTFAGALRTVIGRLKGRYPDLRILVVTPTYSWYPDKELTCEEFDPGGGILKDYVEKELEIAREYGVEVLDFYHDFYPHEKLEDWAEYTWDGIHPNEAGLEKIAAAITDYLEENP